MAGRMQGKDRADAATIAAKPFCGWILLMLGERYLL